MQGVVASWNERRGRTSRPFHNLFAFPIDWQQASPPPSNSASNIQKKGRVSQSAVSFYSSDSALDMFLGVSWVSQVIRDGSDFYICGNWCHQDGVHPFWSMTPSELIATSRCMLWLLFSFSALPIGPLEKIPQILSESVGQCCLVMRPGTSWWVSYTSPAMDTKFDTHEDIKNLSLQKYTTEQYMQISSSWQVVRIFL